MTEPNITPAVSCRQEENGKVYDLSKKLKKSNDPGMFDYFYDRLGGWQMAVPIVLLEHQKDLGINHTELSLIFRILSFLRDPNKKPHISVSFLARQMGLSERQISRLKSSLKERGILVTEHDDKYKNHRYSDIESYSLEPMFRKLDNLIQNKDKKVQHLDKDVQHLELNVQHLDPNVTLEVTSKESLKTSQISNKTASGFVYTQPSGAVDRENFFETKSEKNTDFALTYDNDELSMEEHVNEDDKKALERTQRQRSGLQAIEAGKAKANEQKAKWEAKQASHPPKPERKTRKPKWNESEVESLQTTWLTELKTLFPTIPHATWGPAEKAMVQQMIDGFRPSVENPVETVRTGLTYAIRYWGILTTKRKLSAGTIPSIRLIRSMYSTWFAEAAEWKAIQPTLDEYAEWRKDKPSYIEAPDDLEKRMEQARTILKKHGLT